MFTLKETSQKVQYTITKEYPLKTHHVVQIHKTGDCEPRADVYSSAGVKAPVMTESHQLLTYSHITYCTSKHRTVAFQFTAKE